MSQNNELDRQALKQAVQQCLAKDKFRFNRDLQAIFSLAKQAKPIDKKTYKEIAEMLSISVKAVEKRMHLALKQVREQIGNI